MIIGTLIFILIDNPFSILFNVSLVLLGLGLAGVSITNVYLFN